MNRYLERIELLRTYMRVQGLDAVVLYGSDPHLSEYPAPRWKQIEWLSGFTGESADMAVTMEHAGLWTDSRYFIQANKQLDGSTIVLHKTRLPESVSIEDWLSEELDAEGIVAIDSLCTSVSAYNTLRSRFEVRAIPDLMNVIWKDRPEIPQTPIFHVNTGESRADKIDWLRGQIASKGCDGIMISALDDIAWLLNVRAQDIDYNPLVISYLLVDTDNVKWFVVRGEIDDDTTQGTLELLESEGIQILPYYEAGGELESLPSDYSLWTDPDTLNAELFYCIHCRCHFGQSPVPLRKAQKNPVELDNIAEAHIRDGVAMEKFLFWIESAIKEGRQPDEWEAAQKLHSLRCGVEDFMGESFETISAYGPDGALPHFVTPQYGSARLEPHGLYLNDSGGQYLRGTTDITRTIPLGPCTSEEIHDYSVVLKAHINLAMAIFPSGTPGCRIDAAARLPLWREHLDYGHGTGHGVGYFLGVHEGPTQIRQNLSASPVLPGMVTSIEPGVYKEGRFGVRHENLYVCEENTTSEFGHFVKFRPLTMCHFDTSILDISMFTGDEIKWLNDYNSLVFDTIGPLLDTEERNWLEKKTLALLL